MLKYRLHAAPIIVVPFYNIITQAKVGYLSKTYTIYDFRALDHVALMLFPSHMFVNPSYYY
jgi:hypothetical protein